jgi:hypothetical protein
MTKRKPGHGNNDDLTPEKKALLEKVKKEGEDTRLDYHIWRCDSCSTQPEFTDFATFKAHLDSVHHVPIKTAKVHKEQGMHIDSTKWYQTNYTCHIVGMNVNYVEAIRQHRTGEDALMWMDIG